MILSMAEEKEKLILIGGLCYLLPVIELIH